SVALRKWVLAEEDVEKIVVELSAHAKDAAVLVAPLRKAVKRAHAEFKVTCAKEIKGTDVPKALGLVNQAIPDLDEGSASLLDARNVKADLELRGKESLQ